MGSGRAGVRHCCRSAWHTREHASGGAPVHAVRSSPQNGAKSQDLTWLDGSLPPLPDRLPGWFTNMTQRRRFDPQRTPAGHIQKLPHAREACNLPIHRT
jgi:hypothetical protein